MQPEIDLSGLKDLHLMAQPGFWPLAYGWWVLIGVIGFVLLLTVILWMYWRARPVVYAIRKLNKINEKESDDLIYIKKVSQLLRRVSMAADGRATVAQLSDTKWQHFLQTRAPDTLTEQEAHLIAFAPYESDISGSFNRLVLTDHIAWWIKKVLKNKKSS